MSESKKTAIVTGASSGIGYAIALNLLLDGWCVYGLDQKKVNLNNTQFHSIEIDLNDTQELKRVLDLILGSVVPSAVVHAAGLLRVGSLGDLDFQAGDLMWRTHVEVASKLADRILPAMISKGFGRMILIGSRRTRARGWLPRCPVSVDNKPLSLWPG